MKLDTALYLNEKRHKHTYTLRHRYNRYATMPSLPPSATSHPQPPISYPNVAINVLYPPPPLVPHSVILGRRQIHQSPPKSKLRQDGASVSNKAARRNGHCDNNGNDDRLARDNQIDGGRQVILPHGADPPRPSPTADLTLLLLPSGQAPSMNANAPKQSPYNATDAPTYAPDLWDVDVLGAAENDGMLAFWRWWRTMGCWHFGGMDEDPIVLLPC